nr:MAG TPA: hypothetical protein [Caudoviricetes sp.]
MNSKCVEILIRHEVINIYDIVSSIWKHIENNWKRIIRKINDRIRLSGYLPNVQHQPLICAGKTLLIH